jgi:hypothetical protein
MPEDSAALLEVDLDRLGNHAIFRKILTDVWEESCLVPILLEDGRSLTVAMPDARLDGTTMPLSVLVLGSRGGAGKVLACISEEIAPGAGEPERETYRDVESFGHPGVLPVRAAVANDRMVLLGDRAGIHRMLDTFLDGMPSLAGSGKFGKARGRLPAGAQVRLVALPGRELRGAARLQLEEPWSDLLDAEMLAAGLVFGEDEVEAGGMARLPDDPGRLARDLNARLESLRSSKLARIFGLQDVLAEARFDSSGKDVTLEARAPAKTVGRFLDGAAKIVEIGL